MVFVNSQPLVGELSDEKRCEQRDNRALENLRELKSLLFASGRYCSLLVGCVIGLSMPHSPRRDVWNVLAQP